MPARTTRWKGRCPCCGGFWNVVKRRAPSDDIPDGSYQYTEPEDGEVVSFSDAVKHARVMPRIASDIESVNRVLGGGFAKTGMYLLCGNPGVGKTTILLQILRSIAMLKYDVLYITNEQTTNDLGLAGKRIGKFPERMGMCRGDDLDYIIDKITDLKPAITVIDSAQKLRVNNEMGEELDIGSSTAIKVASRTLQDFAGKEGLCIILIGHVTKDGGISGPRALEHFVDCSLYLEGKKSSKTRILRCDQKNRFGETPVKAYFEMTEKGLVEVPDPKEDDEDATDEEGDEDDRSFMQTIIETARKIKPVRPPRLKSVPPDPTAPKPDAMAPANFWVAPDGTSATRVLAVSCDVDGCRGQVDRACTSADDKRESGFHQSRVTKAKLKIVPDPIIHSETSEEVPPDPFAKKPLGAPPKLKKAKKKTPPKVPPKKPPPTAA